MKNPIIAWTLRATLLAGLAQGPFVWCGYGTSVELSAKAAGKLPSGWVITDQIEGASFLSGSWKQEDRCIVQDLNGAPSGAVHRITALSPIPDGWVIVWAPSDPRNRKGMGLQFLIRNFNKAPEGATALIQGVWLRQLPSGWQVARKWTSRAVGETPTYLVENLNPGPGDVHSVWDETRFEETKEPGSFSSGKK